MAISNVASLAGTSGSSRPGESANGIGVAICGVLAKIDGCGGERRKIGQGVLKSEKEACGLKKIPVQVTPFPE